MVSSAGIERNRRANAKLSSLVQGELAGFFGSLNFSKPELARDALLAFTPILVEKYGAVSETIAIDWYEQMRAESGAVGSFRATAPSAAAGVEQVRRDVRYAAGHLFTENPRGALGVISQSVDKFVKQPGRDTISWNAKREGARWARVPTGRETCSFCLILASRDAVYISERSALQGSDGSKYHGDCDCSTVRIGQEDEYPDGYLPNDYYDMYQIARDEAASGKIGDIATAMRNKFPSAVRDGVNPL